LLRIALSPLDDRGRHLGWHARGEQHTDAYEILVSKALRAVAHRLKCIPTQIAYDVVVKGIEAEALRGRYLIHLHLPISATVIDRMRSRNEALAKAQIVQPARARMTPPPLVETLDAVVSQSGILPSLTYLRKWVRAYDIPVSRVDFFTPYANLVTAVRERRASRGMSTPTTITPADQCPALPEPPQRCQHRRNPARSPNTTTAKGCRASVVRRTGAACCPSGEPTRGTRR